MEINPISHYFNIFDFSHKGYSVMMRERGATKLGGHVKPSVTSENFVCLWYSLISVGEQ